MLIVVQHLSRLFLGPWQVDRIDGVVLGPEAFLALSESTLVLVEEPPWYLAASVACLLVSILLCFMGKCLIIYLLTEDAVDPIRTRLYVWDIKHWLPVIAGNLLAKWSDGRVWHWSHHCCAGGYSIIRGGTFFTVRLGFPIHGACCLESETMLVALQGDCKRLDFGTSLKSSPAVSLPPNFCI